VHKVEHLAALVYADLPAFTASRREQDGNCTPALAFTSLTAARTGAMLFARWDQIEDDVSTAPAERMKGEREHRVPPSRRTLAILDGMEGRQDGRGLQPGCGLNDGASLTDGALARQMLPNRSV
jgi:integrase